MSLKTSYPLQPQVSYADMVKKNFSHSVELEFTISSYNVGGRLGMQDDHYDYWVAASMAHVMGRRYVQESRNMDIFQAIQKLALKILFSLDPKELLAAKMEWRSFHYDSLAKRLTTSWSRLNQAAYMAYEAVIGPYKGTRAPFVVAYEAIEHPVPSGSLIHDMCKQKAQDIFRESLQQDIICLQETHWVDHEMFALSKYDSIFTISPDSEGLPTQVSKNGIAWNQERFEYVKTIDSIAKRALAIQLRDKINGKILSVVSAHISGCNPFHRCEIKKKPQQIRAMEELHETDLKVRSAMAVEVKKYDSDKGDEELIHILSALDREKSDLTVLGMDLNVSSLHPRMEILKNFGYRLDYENYLYPTCTSPVQCLDARIDWIACKSARRSSVRNIPIPEVLLNDVSTNVSDHRPIASAILY